MKYGIFISINGVTVGGAAVETDDPEEAYQLVQTLKRIAAERGAK